jgi:3-phosphoglycerate kinase
MMNDERFDIQFSREFGYRIKLLAITKIDRGKIEARVHPTMIPDGHLLSTIDGVFNAIYMVESQQYYVDKLDLERKTAFVDIGPKTIALFSDRLKKAKTVVWNGPMGIFEKDQYSKGTKMIAEAIAETSATSIVGGGDSAAAAEKIWR